VVVEPGSILDRLRAAQANIGSAVDELLKGEEVRVSWTRLLAHNVNNHLTSILCIIEKFVNADPDSAADQAVYIEGLKDVAGRIQETITRLMHLAKHDTLVTSVPFPITDAVNEAVRRHRGYASLKSIQLSTKVDVDPGLQVMGDRLGFIESLLNLIGNAIKYCDAKTPVETSVAQHDSTVEVRVTDQGPGISPEDQRRLFKVGGIAASKPTAGEPQTGIGLAMSAALVRAMGGDISVASKPGHGSTFTIRLPVAQ
jgi:two-component system sensor histidine kinase SenX3